MAYFKPFQVFRSEIVKLSCACNTSIPAIEVDHEGDGLCEHCGAVTTVRTAARTGFWYYTKKGRIMGPWESEDVACSLAEQRRGPV